MYNEFHCKPSYLMYIIHGVAFLSLEIFLYLQLHLNVWMVCFIVHLICSFIFIRSYPQVLYLGYLDTHKWTLIIQNQEQKQVEITHIIDHLLYIVIYFHPNDHVVIWQDQLDQVHWKGLKTRAKLADFK